MSGSFTISIDPVSFADALAIMRILKSILPTVAVSTISECIEQVKDQIVYETVKVLNIDDARVKDEISVERPSSETLKDYNAVIVSKGKPIELIAFSEDARNWKWKKPTPIHARIYRQGATHEFRHAFVSNGHIYGRKQHSGGGEAPGRVYAWMKYAAKDKALRFPIEILRSVRVQDIQDKSQLIDPATEAGADAVVSDYEKAIDEVFANV